MPNFQPDYSLKALNTLALPAVAQYFCEVRDLDDLHEARHFARERGLAVTLLGGGSNVVLGQRIAGLVVRMANTGIAARALADGRVRLTVGAGENWHELVRYTLEQGWFGLENLALIPGLVGAAPIQNIGAYGVELERFLHGVAAVDLETGEQVRLSAADCELGYRDSVFKGRFRDRFALHAVELDLGTTPAPVLGYPVLAQALEQTCVDQAGPREVYEAVCRIRRSRLPDPARVPNAGSFFKNPVLAAEQAEVLVGRYPDMARFALPDGSVKLAAAWLIDRAGWKGLRHGPVGVHDRQALVLCNPGAGTAEDLLQLARRVAASVAKRFGVELEMEPRCYGCSL